jgi:nucleotide-binding universal stress UspA family protein
MTSKDSKLSSLPGQPPLTAGMGGKLGEIVIFIDGNTEAPSILEFAGVLAEEHGAHLIGVFMQPAPTVTTAQTFARGKGIREVMGVQDQEIEGIEEHQRGLFDDTVRRHGVRSASEWRSLPYLSSEVGVHAYYGDLVIISRPEAADHTAGPPGLAESLVLSSGRPIILFPPRGTDSRVRRVLVAWKATRESIRAVADALPLLARAEVVDVLVVDHQRQRTHGQEPGADIARHLARHGAQVEVRRLSSGGQDVGRLLLSESATFRADLLVMGAYGHSHLSEWMFGGVTRTVLYEAGLPVLMSR